MGFLLVQKPNHSNPENRKASKLSSSLNDFRAKIANFINQTLLKPEPGLEFTSLAWFQTCFDLIHFSNDAFAKMVAEINYPMTKWSSKATEEYLNYSLNLLDLLNSINHSVSHLNYAKVTISHALSLIENSHRSAIPKLKKVPRTNPDEDFKPKGTQDLSSVAPGKGKESAILIALTVLKKTGFLALGLVLSGLCSDDKVYMEIREHVNVSADDLLTSGLDSRLCKEVMKVNGITSEVKNVNFATERLNQSMLTGVYEEKDIESLKKSLKLMEISIHGIEKDANNLFSEVLATRNKLLDNIRLTGKSH